ncbi:TetR/AcrR family transcriptional regulator [Neolewinella aurantiaca]|uniref:TetR/AcrR family transcriptional regulator n=1 Tax=Neolewinella aurantiaca TaxID=2602767 RepID=A0A5C7FIP1_9BACT|nr:TetR/AcrR family transcriptional regulator [Neolewinella aurantiaca]TXF91023.1 TetR/AcrR family transcriptional regulator [Neolewinella aurantiaca]
MQVTSSTTSKTALLKAAKDLFWVHGIKRVSVEEICSTAGLSKMTFYRNFPNKEAIAYELMRSLIRESHADYEEIMERPESLSARLRKVIRVKTKHSQGISDEFLYDMLRSEDPKFKKLIEDGKKKASERLSHYLYESIGRAEIDQDTNVEFILYWLDEISIKMEDEAMIAIFPDPAERIDHLSRLLFFGISGRTNARN